MALENGEAGGEYLNREWWLERGKEGALVVFRINRIEDPVMLRADLKREAMPVNVDFLVVNGSEEGTVYRSERVIQGGIVNTLRTKTIPDPHNPAKRIKVARKPGDDVAVHMSTFPAFGRDHAAANPCGPDEFERVKELFAKTDGDPYTFHEKRALAAVANGETGQPDVDGTDGAVDDDELPF